MAPAVVAESVSHGFKTKDGPLPVLSGLDLTVEAGGYVALVGPSGAGKSTLLSLLGGLEPPQEGTLSVYGQDLGALSRDDLARYRRSTVGFVFQHFGLLETLTAAENVELACTLAGLGVRPRRRRAGELLALVGLEGRTSHRPLELSGGERQRVAIARALVNQPRLVLADEPTGNLDDDSAGRIVELLEALPVALGCTLIIVTHNKTLAARAQRRLALSDGKLHDSDGMT